METGIDCMKYRNSSHLAGIDVEIMIAEKGKCELTIQLAFHDKNVKVNGKKVDGYFLRFEEPVKEMMVNSGNRKAISEMAREMLNCTALESRNTASWTGMKIELMFDPTVKFGDETRGGIRVVKKEIKPKKTLEHATAEFNAVNSRESFAAAQKANKEFMSNPQILEICKKMAVSYPAPQK